MPFADFIKLIEADPLAARKCVDSCPALLGIRNVAGETPLHWLAVENRIASIDFLLHLGADINTVDHFLATPLMHAVRLDYGDLVEFLLEHGADPDAKTVNGDTALSYAVLNEHRVFAPRLLKLRTHDIHFYFNAVDASGIVSAPEGEFRQTVLALGLKDPFRVDSEPGLS